jgi:hypothetical protein
VTEQSDLARDVLSRYRRSISPSAGEREALVQGVVRRIDGGGEPGGGGRGSGSSGMSPWLVVVGVSALVVGAALWGRGAPASGRVDPVFARMSAPVVVPASPTVAVALPRVDAGAPAIASDVPPPAAPVAAAPVAAAPERRAAPRVAKPSVATAPATAPAPEPTLVDDEVRLLREANAALRAGRDADARAGFDEHARRFPQGSLVELREVGRALLRCRGGTADDAAETIAAFERRYPGSPHLARLARECPPLDAP